MPRPRSVPDEEILAAAHGVISRVGPVRLTLADVGREVGLAPATLLQRFGSRKGLLLAVAGTGLDAVDRCFESARAKTSTALDALLAAATDITRHMKTPDELANGLAFLQLDVSDPDFHRLALEHSRRTLAGYRTLLADAVSKGELVPCDTERLARVVHAVSGGAMIAWALHREGPAHEWVRSDVAAVIEPYRKS